MTTNIYSSLLFARASIIVGEAKLPGAIPASAITLGAIDVGNRELTLKFATEKDAKTISEQDTKATSEKDAKTGTTDSCNDDSSPSTWTWQKYEPPMLVVSVASQPSKGYPLGIALRQLMHIVPENYRAELPDLVFLAEDSDGRKWVMNHPYPETLSLAIIDRHIPIEPNDDSSYGRVVKIDVINPLDGFRTEGSTGKFCTISRPVSGRNAKKWQISDINWMHTDEYLALLGELAELSEEYEFYDQYLRETEPDFMSFIHSLRKLPIYQLGIPEVNQKAPN